MADQESRVPKEQVKKDFAGFAEAVRRMQGMKELLRVGITRKGAELQQLMEMVQQLDQKEMQLRYSAPKDAVHKLPGQEDLSEKRLRVNLGREK